MRPKDIRGFTLVELLVVIAIIAIMIAMALPAVQSVRETSRRLTCTNQLARLGLALQDYDTANECLPPGVINPKGPILNEPKGQHVGWIVQVLPYMEEGNVYRRIDQAAGVYDKKNAAARQTVLGELLCPSEIGTVSPASAARGAGHEETPAPPGASSYAGCYHDAEEPIDAKNHGVLFLNSHIRHQDITDGLAHTLFAGEKRIDKDDLGWMSGTWATLRNTGAPPNQTPASAGGFGSSHPGGANFLFGDGSIRFLANTIDAELFQHYGNRADGALPAE